MLEKKARQRVADRATTPSRNTVVPLPVTSGLEGLAAVRVVKLAELLHRLASERFEARFGIRNTDLRILNVLDSYGAISISEIARLTLVDKAWISRSVRQLEEKGLAARADLKERRRSTDVVLTPKGRRLLAQVAPIAQESERALLKGVDAKTFKHALSVAFDNAQRELQQAIKP